MTRIAIWVAAAVVILVAADRLLLYWEFRGWINYRRRGLSKSGAAYHGLILESIFNPAADHLKDVKYAEVIEEEESGDPPGPLDAPPPDEHTATS